MKNRINIVYEDKFILVVNKESGLLTISTVNEKEKTLFHRVYTYIKAKNKNNKIFIVHRLDKDTSGLVVFAKSEDVKRSLQKMWEDGVVKRKYYALVHGNKLKKEDTIISYLKQTKTLFTYSSSDNSGQKAITKYRVINSNNQYSLLDILILTGRKNQIRVHMSDISHPIVGDRKYGIKDNSRKMLLHAYGLEFVHPVTKQKMAFDIGIPKVFGQFIAF